MKPVLPLVAALGAAALTGSAMLAQATTADDVRSTRIVGGTVLTDLAQNPGAIGLHTKVDPSTGNTGMICGAVRISPMWAITAMHCIREDWPPYELSTNTIKRSKGPRVLIDQVIKHPKKVDLTLLKLKEAAPGMMASWSDQQLPKDAELKAYGWGYTDTGTNTAPVLKMAVGKVAGYAKNPIYQEATDVIFKPVDGLCWTGDSGGPVFSGGKLVGVSSWSNGYGTKNGTCGYVSLAHEAAWIKEVTGIAPGQTFPSIPDPNPTPPDAPSPTATSAPAPQPTGTPTVTPSNGTITVTRPPFPTAFPTSRP